MKIEHILGKKNVIGHRETHDTVFVFVSKKEPLEALAEKDIIPKKLKTKLFTSKPTQVIEIGEIRAQ